jgi:hypothetical protein
MNQLGDRDQNRRCARMCWRRIETAAAALPAPSLPRSLTLLCAVQSDEPSGRHANTTTAITITIITAQQRPQPAAAAIEFAATLSRRTPQPPRPRPLRVQQRDAPVLQGRAAVVTTDTVRPCCRRLLSGRVGALRLLRRQDEDPPPDAWRSPDSLAPPPLRRFLTTLPMKKPVMKVAVVWMSRTSPIVRERVNAPFCSTTGWARVGGGSHPRPVQKGHISLSATNHGGGSSVRCHYSSGSRQQK